MDEILENATIIFKNGDKEFCNAISIGDKGVYTGKVKSINENSDRFINFGFIPKDQIQKIIISNDDGKSKDIDFQ